MSAVAVATDAGDGGTGGSGLLHEGISEGRGEKKMKYVKSQLPPPPPSSFISLQRQSKSPFRYV